MTNMRGARWIGVAALMFAVVAGATAAIHSASGASAQDDSALLKVVAPPGEIKKGAEVPVQITVENAKNMASFQFDLKFNADIFAAEDTREGGFAEKGDFLGSTGRQVVCNQPESDAGVVRADCVTLGPTPPGVNGSGVLMTVYLKATGSGSTELTLDRVQANVVNETADVMPTSTQGATLSVAGGGGFNYLLWIPIIAVAALIVAGGIAFGAMRVRGSAGKPATAT